MNNNNFYRKHISFLKKIAQSQQPKTQNNVFKVGLYQLCCQKYAGFLHTKQWSFWLHPNKVLTYAEHTVTRNPKPRPIQYSWV